MTVFVAYGYFILLGMAYLSLSLYVSGQVSYLALTIIALFGLQFKFRHKLANLIIGVLTLGGSVFATLGFVSNGLKNHFNLFSGTMASVFIIGIIFSGILIFSYAKLSFKDT